MRGRRSSPWPSCRCSSRTARTFGSPSWGQPCFWVTCFPCTWIFPEERGWPPRWGSSWSSPPVRPADVPRDLHPAGKHPSAARRPGEEIRRSGERTRRGRPPDLKLSQYPVALAVPFLLFLSFALLPLPSSLVPFLVDGAFPPFPPVVGQ